MISVQAKAQSTDQIYVSTSGSASALGTSNDPVNSIEKAISLASAKATGSRKIEIIVRGGSYYVERSVNLLEGKNWNSTTALTIKAYGKDLVTLHGGRTVPAEMIKAVSDKGFYTRFQPEFRDKIRQIDLKALNIDPGKLRPVGFGRPFGPSWMEVFFNSNPGVIARWPNKGTVPIDSVINPDSLKLKNYTKVIPEAAFESLPEGKGMVAIRPWTDTLKNPKPDVAKRVGTFFYDDPRPSKWKEPKKAWLTGFFMWGYADDAVPVDKVDTIRRIITTAMTTRYGFASGKPWRAYYAYNIPEEIDVPGEYYVDSTSHMLYFLPPKDLKTIDISINEAPLMELNGVKNVRIENIRFATSRGMGIYMEQTDHVRIDGCTFYNLGMMGVFMGRGMEPSKDEKTPTPISRVWGDIPAYNYENPTFDSKAGTDNGILNCVLYNTGAGGFYIQGGDRLTLTRANNFVKNCQLHDFDRIEKTYRPGIYIAGVGNSISNCEIFNSPSVGVYIHGNNHVIEYNDIHHTTLEVDDMGAVYIGRDPSERGNAVRYNFFHNVGGLNKTMAIYNDDGACGMDVIGNIFYRAGQVSGFIGGGQDNRYINNIFLNNRYAMHIDRRLNNWAKGVVKRGGLFEKRLNAVNYLQPPYSTAYPQLKNYFDQGPTSPQRNLFYMNVMVNIEHKVEGDTTLLHVDKRNFETIGDPGFKDYRKLDFRLKKNSIIYNELPGFVAPPLDKMGYRKERVER